MTVSEDDDDVSSTSGDPETISRNDDDKLRMENSKLFNGESGGIKRSRMPSNGSEQDAQGKRMKADDNNFSIESELLGLDSSKRRRLEHERNTNLNHVGERPSSPEPTF